MAGKGTHRLDNVITHRVLQIQQLGGAVHERRHQVLPWESIVTFLAS